MGSSCKTIDVCALVNENQGNLNPLLNWDLDLYLRLSLVKNAIKNKRAFNTFNNIAKIGRKIKFMIGVEQDVTKEIANEHLNCQLEKTTMPLFSFNNATTEVKTSNVALIQGFFGQDPSHV